MAQTAQTIVVAGDVQIEWRFAQSKIRERGGGALFDAYNYMELTRRPVGAVSVGDIIRKTLAGLPYFGDSRTRPNVIAPERDQLDLLEEQWNKLFWRSYAVCAQLQIRAGQGANDGSAWRIAQKLGIDRRPPDTPLKDLVAADIGDASLLVIEQSQQGFAPHQEPAAGTNASDRGDAVEREKARKSWAAWPASLREPDPNQKPWVVVEWMRPQFERDHDFWRYLTHEERFFGRVVVVLTAEDLRLSGLRISRALSWERTVEDLYRELREAWPRSFKGCAHLVVSFGTSGAVIFSARSGNLDTAKLIYDPSAAEGEWAAQFPGSMSGSTRCITAATALELITADVPGTLEGHGVKAGVIAARRLLESGYDAYGEPERKDTALPGTLNFPTDSISAVIRTVLAQSNDTKSKTTTVDEANELAQKARCSIDQLKDGTQDGTVPQALSDELDTVLAGVRPEETAKLKDETVRIWRDKKNKWRENVARTLCLITPDLKALEEAKRFKVATVPLHSDLSRWRIADDNFPRGGEDSKEATAILEMARKVVEYGLVKGPRDIPTARIGDLFIADREELEELRAVRDLLVNYMGSTAASKPLSIAVFGSPGSGKSFAIKELAKELSGKKSAREPALEIVPVEFNLSQFSDTEGLAVAFHQVRDVGLSGKLPLVFWDEFDTNFGTPLGWLRYFLAPMQDGKFQDRTMVHNIGRAIFVFAGGTHANMADFTERAKINGRQYSSAAVEAKVPDFLSRLSGFVDVPSLDYEGPAWRSIIDAGTALRRAVILHAGLKKSAGKLGQSVVETKDGREVPVDRLNVDSNVTEAFLRINEFTYGARSIEAIVRMSPLTGKDMYDRSSLPPADQLQLHVDAQRFLDYSNTTWPT